MSAIDWTQVLLALISVLGGALSTWMAGRSRSQAGVSAEHASRAELAAKSFVRTVDR